MFDQILELKGKYDEISIYPSVLKTEYGYDTKKLNKGDLIKIKEKLSKNKLEKSEQIEYYHKNLVKIEKIFQNGTHQCMCYMKYNSNFVQYQNDLIVMNSVENIEESQFPNLNNYDKVVRKTIEKYNFGSFNVLLITEKGTTILCIDVLNFDIADKIKLEKFLK